ncbi:MAG: hydroxymethylglutaryl-CoA lyase [Candidatus Cloacimonetes bacterium]|nr:hydroxymethylglutaryl-CoA lyase [Candidatus Cloacimonadota bacterium]
MIRIVEVGPRDGLQSIKQPIPISVKLDWIEKLINSGLKEVEMASFVSPKWVPQMADSLEICQRLKHKNSGFWGLVPNEKGYESFLDSGLKQAAFFTAVSDEFNQKNVNRDFLSHLKELEPLMQKAVAEGLRVRLYVSTVFDCPYSGSLPEKLVAKRLSELVKLPFHDLSLGDTIGRAVPKRVRALSRFIKSLMPLHQVSWHFHDTYGMALANCAQALELGFQRFDTSASGLGGCPYAPGASGNMATEDLVFFLEGQGERTGIDWASLCSASEGINRFLNRNTRPKTVR